MTACEPLFAHFRESRYEQKFVMVSNLTQKRVLQDKLDFDEDRMHEVDDILESNPNRPVLFPDNLCKLGFWLTGIQNGTVGTMIDFCVIDIVQLYSGGPS